MTPEIPYVVITPVRDEAANITRLAECMIDQSVAPRLWLIADDGSTDGTRDLAESYASRFPFIRTVAVSAPSRTSHASSVAEGAVPRAFNKALRDVDVEWDVIVKLDGDVTFGSDYFEGLLQRFSDDPRLGIAGGHCFEQRGDKLKMEWVPDYHVRGATKAYRRACFDEIGGVEEVLGWDGIDEIKAHMAGWRTRSFAELPVLHHRPTGSRGGTLKGRVRGGRCNYFLGYSPSFMVARSIRRMADRPYVIGGLAMLWGYTASMLAGRERYHDQRFVEYLRSTQRSRLARSVSGLLRAGR